MSIGAISKRFGTIAQFIVFKDFISFERKGRNKVKRIENIVICFIFLLFYGKILA